MSNMESTRMLRQPIQLLQGHKGPVTASRHRRNAVVYALLCLLALLPVATGQSAAWQAAGLGLFMPGAGFLALGGAWALLFPLTVFVFWLAVIAWFWSGMVVAPLTLWLGTAALAGWLAGEAIWPPAVYLAPAAAAATFLFFQYRGAKRRAKDREHFKFRQSFFAESLAEVHQRAATEPEPGERELTPDQLQGVRYLLELALQPVGQYKGYTIIDQFQPAALRYQLNHIGFALGMVQGHYTPNFQGYLGQAQRNVIDTYRERKVWGYWVYESMWGHFNFSDFDPARKDNIMLTGWYGMHVGQYMLNAGDTRYSQPGSLSFRLNDKTCYHHDIHSINQSVRENFQSSDFCLYPCEPNWVYPVCNMYGMSSLAVYDTLFERRDTAQVLPKWLHMLDTEFTDQKGSLVGLRSYWTGLEMPFYTGEAGFAFFANIFSTDLARKLWAVGRKELSMCLTQDAEGQTRLTLPKEALAFFDTIDAGNYRPGKLFAYVAVQMCAREFGDDELAEAARRSMDQDCGPVVENGVARYTKGSTLANIWGVEGRLMRTGDFRNSFVKGPPSSVFDGPLLGDARYPEILVAKAFSRGDDLELVLYPGAGDGPQTLGFERLKPGVRYVVEGAASGEFTADADGRASLAVTLSGRTALHIKPGH